VASSFLSATWPPISSNPLEMALCFTPHPPVLQKSAEARDFKELGLRSLFSRLRKTLKRRSLQICVFLQTQKSAQSTDVAWLSENNRVIKIPWEIGTKVKSRRTT
jgi:hypothetical protein